MDIGEPMDIDEISPASMKQLGQIRLNETDNTSMGPMLEKRGDVKQSQIEVTQSVDSIPSLTPHRSTIFSPSSPAPPIATTDGWVTAYFNDYTATLSNVEGFTRFWRPSPGANNFVPPTTQWLAIKREPSSALSSTSPGPPRIVELKTAFDALASGRSVNGHLALTVSSLDELALQYNVLAGKWMIFATADIVDELWEDIVQMVCMYRKRGSAKVSVNADESNKRVICVYVDNCMDSKEVRGLREDLRTVVGVKERIPFKMDAYTHMGIYRGNKWGIPPTRWFA